MSVVLRPGRKSLIAVAICTALAILYAIAGFLVAPPLVKSHLTSGLSELLGRPVNVSEVRINPFALSFTVRGLEIKEPDNTPLAGFEELFINLRLSSIVHRALMFEEIRLRLPYGLIRVRPDGSLNLSGLVPRSAPTKPDAGGEESQAAPRPGNAMFPVLIDLLEVERGALEFHDESKPTPFQADIVPIHFILKNFRTYQASEGFYQMTAELDEGEIMDWAGTLSLQPLRSEGYVALTGFKARTLTPYLQDHLRIEMTDGLINLKARYQVETRGETTHTAITAGEVSLRNVKVSEKGASERLLAIPFFTAEGVDIDFSKRQAVIASVRSSEARITVWRDHEGRVNYQTLLVSEPVRQYGARPAKAPMPLEPQPAAWSVGIHELALENFHIVLQDRKAETPVVVTLDPLRLTLRHISNQPGAKVDLDLAVQVNGTGTVVTTGTIEMNPLSADLELNVSQIALKPFQPYVNQMATLEMVSGAADLKGQLRYRSQHTDGPRIRYEGAASVHHFTALDRALSKDFLRWQLLAARGLSLEVEPTRVAIEEIIAQKPYAQVIIGPDQTVNLSTILTTSNTTVPAGSRRLEQGQPTASKRVTPMPVRIGMIRIIDGSANFADFSLQPIVDAGIQELTGTIKGLSSARQARADLSLEGKVDKYAPVKITGQINPLSNEPDADLALSLKNVDLKTVSPYATKFAGYPIVKGKMSLDLKYKLSKNALIGENEIVINQLTLGERVESPDATSLPVKLAIALLKDRNGVIDIDLPVRGDLNDPELHYGRLLRNALANLLTKIVASPFAALGRLFGGSGEELDHIEFRVGSASLLPEQADKLHSIAKALEARPALRLEVTGAVDQKGDRVALAEAKLRRELLGMKLKNLKAQDDRSAAGSPIGGEIELTDTEYAELLQQAYAKKFGQAPSSQIENAGAALPVSVLKERVLGTITVDEAELRDLAKERAAHIQDYLVTQGGIPAERVFLVDVNIDATSKEGSVPSSLALSAE